MVCKCKTIEDVQSRLLDPDFNTQIISEWISVVSEPELHSIFSTEIPGTIQ